MIVVSVHSDYNLAFDACNSLYSTYGVVGHVKESSTGYGFVVFTYDENFNRVAKYDLSHLA